MFGLYLISHMAEPHETTKLDNQAVTKVAGTSPIQEESYTDLKEPLAATVRRKSLIVQRIKEHRGERKAIDDANKQDIRYNNITDGLAKQAARLAPQDIYLTGQY